MVNGILRCGVGILGSALAVFMYGAPLGTFRKVLAKRTTDDMSGIPYAIGLFNCLVYMWYASPLISQGWDNALVMAINTIGLLLECSFVAVYLRFAPLRSRRGMVLMVVGASTVFVSMAALSMWAMNSHAQKKLLVGTVGTVATIILYGSPLSDIRMVVRTKSVEFMSFYFSLFALLGSVLWMVYGALSKDILIMAPNFLGIPLALVQMIVYCIYKYRSHKKGVRVEVEDGKLQVELQEKTSTVTIKDAAHTPAAPHDAHTDIEMQMKKNIS